MTTPNGAGSAVVPADQYSGLESGLGDIAPEDLRMPRIGIDKDTGEFVDSMTNAQYPRIDAILLGCIKQRVLWQPNMPENPVGPMCKSPDFETGYPTMQGSPEELFPWAASGWSADQLPKDTEGRVMASCATCRLKEWGSHPDGKKTWCSEQWAVPIIFGAEGETPSITALMTFQRSSLAPIRTYFGGLFQQQRPAFSKVAVLRLQAKMRGRNKYYVPIIQGLSDTDQAEWPMYSTAYMTVRRYIAQPPRVADKPADAASVAAANTVSSNATWAPGTPAAATTIPGQVVTPTPTPPTPPAQPAMPVLPVVTPSVVARDSDDDLPF